MGDFALAVRGNRIHEASARFDKDWIIAVRAYPEIERSRVELEKLSPALSLNFQVRLLASRSFENARALCQATKDQYFRRFFGESAAVRVLATFLLKSNRRDLAGEFNEMVQRLGSPSQSIGFLAEFMLRHGIGRTVALPNWFAQPNGGYLWAPEGVSGRQRGDTRRIERVLDYLANNAAVLLYRFVMLAAAIVPLTMVIMAL